MPVLYVAGWLLLVAIGAGLVIRRMNPLHLVKPWVFDIPAVSGAQQRMDWGARFAPGWSHVRDIVPKVAPDIVAGVVVDGRVVHSGGIPNRAQVEGWFAA